MKKDINIVYSLLIISLFFFSCASPAQIQEMQVDDLNSPRTIIDYVNIRNVIGGKRTFPFGFGKPTIQNDDFREALVLSLEQSSIVKRVLEDTDWTLDVEIIEASDPNFIIINSTVDTKIHYKIYFRNKIVFDVMINETGSAGFEEERFAVTRIRVAMQLSAKNNIRKFLKRISKLNFSLDGKIITDGLEFKVN